MKFISLKSISMKSISTQRGVALLVALLVVALASILIASLLDRGELGIARTRNTLREAQAQAYAQGLEAYAARVLQQAIAQQGTEAPDTNASVWAIPLPPLPVDGGTISATMRDRNGCFNLNNLIDAQGNPAAQWPDKFVLLLKALKLDPNIGQVVLDWMRSGAAPSSNGASDAYYLGQQVPYRSAQRPFVHVSELRLLKGIDGNVYARLAPHVCALPIGTRININTASVPVLMTLGPTVTEQMAQSLWQQGHANFSQVADAETALGFPFGRNCPQCYDVHSSYFLARGDIALDGLPFTFFSLIERNYSGGGTASGIHVIQRSRGSDQ